MLKIELTNKNPIHTDNTYRNHLIYNAILTDNIDECKKLLSKGLPKDILNNKFLEFAIEQSANIFVIKYIVENGNIDYNEDPSYSYFHRICNEYFLNIIDEPNDYEDIFMEVCIDIINKSPTLNIDEFYVLCDDDTLNNYGFINVFKYIINNNDIYENIFNYGDYKEFYKKQNELLYEEIKKKGLLDKYNTLPANALASEWYREENKILIEDEDKSEWCNPQTIIIRLMKNYGNSLDFQMYIVKLMKHPKSNLSKVSQVFNATPLLFACKNNLTKYAFEILEITEKNIFFKDKNNKSALDYCIENGMTNIAMRINNIIKNINGIYNVNNDYQIIITNKQEDCAICIEKIISEHDKYCIKCINKHKFHSKCIEKWKSTSRGQNISCPVCRCGFIRNKCQNQQCNNQRETHNNNRTELSFSNIVANFMSMFR